MQGQDKNNHVQNAIDFWYHKNWFVEEFVNDTGLKVKDTIKEPRDVLLVRRMWNMMACNVHVVDLSLEIKEEVNEKSALCCKKQLKIRSKKKPYVK